jgi:hypothetical protein
MAAAAAHDRIITAVEHNNNKMDDVATEAAAIKTAVNGNSDKMDNVTLAMGHLNHNIITASQDNEQRTNTIATKVDTLTAAALTERKKDTDMVEHKTKECDRIEGQKAYQTRTINNLSERIIKLQDFARIDREARAEGEKWAAVEKAKYESQLATVDAFRAYEKVLYAGAVKQWQDQQQLITNILTAHLSIDHAAETVALIKTKDDRLKLQCDLIDAYQTQLTRGTMQMEENANKYRADLSDALAREAAATTRLRVRQPLQRACVLCSCYRALARELAFQVEKINICV